MNKHVIVLAMMLLLSLTTASKILVVSPTPFVGQWLYFEEFIKSLLKEGHEVTAVASYKVRKYHENFSEYLVPAFDYQDHCKLLSFLMLDIIG